jgi:hypothetical protein
VESFGTLEAVESTGTRIDDVSVGIFMVEDVSFGICIDDVSFGICIVVPVDESTHLFSVSPLAVTGWP